MFKADHEAIEKLVEMRVPCNDALVNDPACQTTFHENEVGAQPVVGLLGVLNGVFGTRSNGWGWIGANFDDDNKMTGFVVLEDTALKDT